ncbi:hypothetical protein [Fimbriiglobus ruber]|uniref:Uncharacterized protein n=1 Tax=Fimbriiglobus ruber TaxID=1908690 RepID=A0A225E3V6_9BACT|nr:hypothetical protein [Fimbriiglobus ruber]OWK45478.1 hypothetical protein FRUB_01809 [Fimbriiglobus ruber]
MSFDLTVQVDDAHSQFTPHGSLAAFIESLPHIRRLNPDLFALDDPPARRMNMSLEVSDAGGDSTSATDAGRAEVNCVRFHIPYDQLGDEPEQDYFPTAWAVAQFLGWRLYDQQLGEYVVEGAIPIRERGKFAETVRRALGPE